jgi:hypothetical protein
MTSAPTPWREMARSVPVAIAMKINIVADLVGDTGIDPVTSSV